MELTNGEKLILIMLSDIQKKLGIDGAIDPDFITKAISSDHTWALEWEYGYILNGSKKHNPPTVNEVNRILTMWRVVEQAHDKLSGAAKRKIKDAVPFCGVAFYGFDGNNETEHLSVAQFMVKELGQFEEFKERDFNSHRQTLPHYRGMLEEFERVVDADGYNPSEEQLLNIFQAGYA